MRFRRHLEDGQILVDCIWIIITVSPVLMSPTELKNAKRYTDRNQKENGTKDGCGTALLVTQANRTHSVLFFKTMLEFFDTAGLRNSLFVLCEL